MIAAFSGHESSPYEELPIFLAPYLPTKLPILAVQKIGRFLKPCLLKNN
jgi:hypothetical protein